MCVEHVHLMLILSSNFHSNQSRVGHLLQQDETESRSPLMIIKHITHTRTPIARNFTVKCANQNAKKHLQQMMVLLRTVEVFLSTHFKKRPTNKYIYLSKLGKKKQQNIVTSLSLSFETKPLDHKQGEALTFKENFAIQLGETKGQNT